VKQSSQKEEAQEERSTPWDTSSQIPNLNGEKSEEDKIGKGVAFGDEDSSSTASTGTISPSPTISQMDVEWMREKRDEMADHEGTCKTDTGARMWWEPWSDMWRTVSSYPATWEAICPKIWRYNAALKDMFMRKFDLPAKCLILILEILTATEQTCSGGMEVLDQKQSLAPLKKESVGANRYSSHGESNPDRSSLKIYMPLRH
jgi:hypothetical protein